MDTVESASEEFPFPGEAEGDEVDVDLSVVIAVRDPERAAPIRELYRSYKRQIEQTDLRYEFVFVIEGRHPSLVEVLSGLQEEGERIKILVFARWYGDATVLSAGFEHASGSVLMTLPAYHQIEPETLPRLIAALEGNDMVVVRRSPRVDGAMTRFQVRVFHAILRRLLGFNFHDLGCSVRIFRTKVIEAVHIYGDQHRFLPVLASHYGFRVREIEAPQTKHDTFQRHVALDVYVNRLLDLLSIFFLAKFTKKPLRFFGFTGVLVFTGGFGLTLYLTIQRLFMGVPLADKPMLLLGVLLIVLGILFFAIGLIGEMIIFTHAGDLKEYTIDRVID